MSTQILLDLPDDVYGRIKKLAIHREQDVSDILLETIKRSFLPFPRDPQRETMEREVEAYQAMHPELIRKYRGEYVAIHEGRVVAHDSDPVALLQRIRSQFPNQIVLRRKVEANARPEIQIRRPRFADTLSLRGMAGGTQRVDRYTVRIRIAEYEVHAIAAVAIAAGSEPIIGRDVLNELVILLNGPAGVTEVTLP
jgi:hypothetical protein